MPPVSVSLNYCVKHNIVFYCAFIIHLIIKPRHVLSDKQTLLNKGLKYNLSYKQKDWIRMLALEAERAIS